MRLAKESEVTSETATGAGGITGFRFRNGRIIVGAGNPPPCQNEKQQIR